MSDSSPSSIRTVYRACNLCEAICGLEFKLDGDKIVSIRGDDADPFSRGHVCPKAVALKDIHEDPDRLRRPMKRVGDQWHEIGWDEAFAFAAERIADIQAAHGNEGFGFYAGNPTVHNSGSLLSLPRLAKTLKTKSVFSATSVDQLPQQLVCFLMYGHQFLIPIPDIDHTSYMLILGGNPIASNGSIMTAPDIANRLKAIRARGGKVVLFDPRRTETAEVASEHHFIRPGSDAALLMAIVNVLRERTSSMPNAYPNAEKLEGLDRALDAIRHVTPEVAARVTGIDAATIRRIATDFGDAPSAVCYGRMGTTVQAFGTLCQWLVQLLNIVTGNLDSEGGSLPTDPVIPMTGPGTRPGHYAEWRSRVRGLPESAGELPVAALAEEILTPGQGQIRGMLTLCGNPVLSTPNGRQLDRAFASLEFMVSIDIYINETTRHAHLILPPASSLQHDHYDTVFNAFAIRNVTRYNEALWPRADEERYDWEIFNGLGGALSARNGREFSPSPPPAMLLGGIIEKVGARHGVTAASLRAAPHGIDLGALKPSLFKRLQTPDQKVQCAPEPVLADLARFNRELLEGGAVNGKLQLIGRRHVRSNNSWMHQFHRLTKGKPRHQLWMHPDDLKARGLASGQTVEVRSAVGSVRIPVEASDDVMRGVACLPHGWGHDRPGAKLNGASRNPGVSYNDLSDDRLLDAVSGNAALNGLPVEVVAA
jgi:anaerobic selenocysteine-containing dehydrogenase